MKKSKKKIQPVNKVVQAVLPEADHALFLEVVEAITGQENKPNKVSLFLKEKFLLPVIKQAKQCQDNGQPLTDVFVELPF